MADSWYFDVLPCRPEPYVDECLTGYLLRLAAANGADNFRAFVGSLFPEWSATRRVHGLRWEYPLTSWGILPQRTQLPVARFVQMTLWSWVAKFRTPPPARAGARFCPGQILHPIVRPTLQACPLCLQEQPYRRLLWRLQRVTACVAHGCWLQDICHACGQPLPVVRASQRHLRCGHCGVDLRQLPVVTAPEETLMAEVKQQADWRYLLDGTVRLIPEEEVPAHSALPRMIGLRFRYLRYQTGLSVAELAQQTTPTVSQIRSVEHGFSQRWIPLTAYLAYLQGLAMSWPDFAAVQVPPAFLARQLEPQWMHLRLCPTAGCPNHRPPPGLGVILRRHFRERKLIVLKCKACQRKFTRTYTGELVTKVRHPPLPRESRVTVAKPAAEIEQVRQLGLQGRSIRHITSLLGWNKETVRACWLMLGMAEEVRLAQKERWQRKGQQLRAALWVEVEQVMETLCQQDEPVTMIRVAQALGRGETYLYRYPEIAGHVRKLIAQHKAQRKARVLAAVAASARQAIAACRQQGQEIDVDDILAQAGTTIGFIQYHAPELWDTIRQAQTPVKKKGKSQQPERQRQQIDEAAARLAAQGKRLTKAAIIAEARKVMPISTRSPQVKERLNKWVGDFGPRT